MKRIMAIAAAAVAAAVFAQEADKPAPAAEKAAAPAAPAGGKASEEKTYVSVLTGRPWQPGGKLTFEEFKERDRKAIEYTGGFIFFDAEGPRAMAVDTRAREHKTLEDIARLYKRACKLDMDVRREPRGDKCPMEMAQGMMKADRPLMLVLVVENCGRLPALSVFPEERIGIVNADKLKGGEDKDPAIGEMRVTKEVWRAMGFIAGVGFSAQPNDMMQPFATLEDLDSSDNAYIQPMNMMKMDKFWKRWGVKQPHKVPYRAAIRQGWASPPTNDLQRAVWEQEKTNKVHKAAAPAAAK